MAINKYDYLVVGSGLYGCAFAYIAKAKGKKCLVIDKRPQLGGNVYCEEIEGIHVHKYGAHIFHTSHRQTWDFVNSIAEFRPFVNSPLANYHGKLYNLPFNMNTFHELWGVTTPKEAQEKIQQQIRESGITEPSNLEEQAISLVGKDIYEVLIKEYTEKQWGRKCTELPAFIIKRLPVRFTYDNNYFNDTYQGIPVGGYNALIDGLLKGIETRTGTDFAKERNALAGIADKILYTGPIDEFFDYQLGKLQYRSLRFETEILDTDNYQGNAVVNYTSHDVAYTRIIEHKHFEHSVSPKTVVSREYSLEGSSECEPFYPINDDYNSALAEKYRALAMNEKGFLFGGRLAEYKYYDMDKIIDLVLSRWSGK